MKKIPLIAVGILCAVSVAVGAAAAGVIQEIKAQLRPDFTVVVDGEEQIFKDVNGNVVDPILYEGTTYLPLRAIGQLMGKTVYWYEEDKRIELKETTVTDADVIIHDEEAAKPKDEKVEKKDKKEEPKVVGKQEDVQKKPQENPTEAKEGIGADKAKDIALNKAGFTEEEVRMERVELDRERGKPVYEVEFHKGNVEYSAEIDAQNGNILSWDVDYDD